MFVALRETPIKNIPNFCYFTFQQYLNVHNTGRCTGNTEEIDYINGKQNGKHKLDIQEFKLYHILS
jgi:hypothetical protein